MMDDTFKNGKNSNLSLVKNEYDKNYNRQELNWCDDVMSKMNKNPRQNKESPLKIWWLQNQDK